MPAPEKLTIDTPEQIALEFPLAGAGSRFLAMAIDTLIQAAGFVMLGLIAIAVLSARTRGPNAVATWLIAVLILIAFTLYYGYFAAFEAMWGGQTPGKRAMGLRVITVNGQPITPFDSLLRNFLRIVDQLPGIYAVGVIAMFCTARNQRVGDLVAGTVVVREEAMERAADPEPAIATHFGASRLSVEELNVIETFLTRRADLPEVMRTRTAHQLAERIRRRLAIANRDDDEALIEAIAAEYRRR